MASPLASTSKHVLGAVQQKPSLKRCGLQIAALGWPRTRNLSQSSRRFAEEPSQTASSTSQDVTSSSASSSSSDSPAYGSQKPSQGQEAPAQSVVAQSAAARKAYYDNLEVNERRAQFDAERERLHMRAAKMRSLADLGSTQTRDKNLSRPHQARINPVTARELTISHLMAAQAHLGHAKSRTNQASASFVYGTRHGEAIIDVERFTLPALRLACKVVKDTVFRDGVVVFIGTADGTEATIIQAAKRLGANGFYVTRGRWLPGTLSNASKVMARAVQANMGEYEEQVVEEELSRRPAMGPRRSGERFTPRREEDPTPDPSDIAAKRLKPDLIIVMNPKNNRYAIQEATLQGIPTIGVIDTDVDPRLVTYAIPANDESIRTADLIAGLLSKAGEEGAKERAAWDDEMDKRRRMEARRQRMQRMRAESSGADGGARRRQE